MGLSHLQEEQPQPARDAAGTDAVCKGTGGLAEQPSAGHPSPEGKWKLSGVPRASHQGCTALRSWGATAEACVP